MQLRYTILGKTKQIYTYKNNTIDNAQYFHTHFPWKTSVQIHNSQHIPLKLQFQK